MPKLWESLGAGWPLNGDRRQSGTRRVTKEGLSVAEFVTTVMTLVNGVATGVAFGLHGPDAGGSMHSLAAGSVRHGMIPHQSNGNCENPDRNSWLIQQC